MTTFANADAFSDPRSLLRALGAELSGKRAIVDEHGRVVAYAMTGGTINPARFELHPRETIYRFGSSTMSTRDVGEGGWWVQKREFERLLNFANTYDLYVGVAMRLLCLVPPEWSDAGVLIRARVSRSLLAWRGFANSVVTPAAVAGGVVRMPHQNDISARRLHQLFIPGLANTGTIDPPLRIEQVFRLDPRESRQGFLYL